VAEDVRGYQLHLIEQKFSWSHINQVACTLRFFCGVTLGQKEAFERIVSGKEPEKLPPVLNREEIACGRTHPRPYGNGFKGWTSI
jgi:integrase/recombinase XerD